MDYVWSMEFHRPQSLQFLKPLALSYSLCRDLVTIFATIPLQQKQQFLHTASSQSFSAASQIGNTSGTTTTTTKPPFRRYQCGIIFMEMIQFKISDKSVKEHKENKLHCRYFELWITASCYLDKKLIRPKISNKCFQSSNT